MKKAKSTDRVDMSPEAVEARLRDLASMYALGMSLMKARILGPVEQLDRRRTSEGRGDDAAHPDRKP